MRTNPNTDHPRQEISAEDIKRNLSATNAPFMIRDKIIIGKFDISGLEIKSSLQFLNCVFEEPIILRSAKILFADFSGCNIAGIIGEDLEVTGSLHFDKGFTSTRALQLRGLRVKGSVHFTSARIDGSVPEYLPDTQVLAIDLSNCEIGRTIFLNDEFEAHGQVRLRGSRIGNDLDCRGGLFDFPGEDCLVADGARIGGYAYLCDKFIAKGIVNFHGATIGQEFVCSGARLENSASDGSPGGIALDLRQVHIGSSFTLAKGRGRQEGGAQFVGGLSLVSANIDGDLVLGSAHIIGCKHDHVHNSGHHEHLALAARRLKVGGSVFLDKGFRCEGTVEFAEARIGGTMRIVGAEIIGKSSSKKTSPHSLVLRDARIEHSLVLREPNPKTHAGEKKGKTRLVGDLDLRNLTVHSYFDDSRAWPKPPAKIALDGFRYEHLIRSDKVRRRDAHVFARKWLMRQPSRALRGTFSPQPWRQMIRVFHDMGDTVAARRLAIESERARRRSKQLTWRDWLWSVFIGAVVGYGYRPRRAVILSFMIVGLGWLVFAYAGAVGAMSPSDPNVLIAQETLGPDWVPSGYQQYDPLLFAVDAFVPVLALGAEATWTPNSRARFQPADITTWLPASVRSEPLIVALTAKVGAILNTFIENGWLRYFYTTYVVSGWILISLAIAGFTGLLRPK